MGVGLNFSPELFTQLDSIAISMELLIMIFAGIPDAQPIKKRKSSAIEELLPGGLILIPEENCAREDALEAINQSPVLNSIAPHSKFFQDF